MQLLAKCEFLFLVSSLTLCGYLCEENPWHFLLFFLESGVLALSWDENEMARQLQALCAITFRNVPLLCAQSPLSEYYGAVTSHSEMIWRGNAAARRQCGSQ
jgi:hypothetical protein